LATITPPYHIALVVEDVERAIEEMSSALHLTWARVQRRIALSKYREEGVEVDMCFTYSLQGPPYLELIEQREGTMFARLGLHHIGVWTDDPASESSRLETIGWHRESVGIRPDGSWSGALFHIGTGQLRVEVVDIGASGPKLACYLAGGDYGPRAN
jgi:hypothetical protein